MAVWNVIDHTELTGLTSSWTKTSIPSSYDHLCLVASMRDDRGYNVHNALLNLNGDTGSKYSATYMKANNSSGATSVSYTTGTKIEEITLCGNGAAADSFGLAVFWFMNYSITDRYKTVLIRASAENNVNTNTYWNMQVIAGLYEDNSAIHTITLTADQSDDFMEYSTFTLYGINGV